MRRVWIAVFVIVGLGRDCRAVQGTPGEWIALTGDPELAAWKAPQGDWASVPSVRLRESNERFLDADAGHGEAIYNGARGKTSNLLTRRWFGDVELECEFLVPKGSNSGIKFEGLYEIQIADSYGKEVATASDCGGIYPRAELYPMYHHIDDGTPPRTNACAAPGTWQRLEVVFHAPRFDETGKKVKPARFERVVLNGQVIHQGVDLAYPTGHAWHKAEVPEGPIFLQGDHGPVAFRNLRVRPLDEKSSATVAQHPHEEGLNRPFVDPKLNVDDFVKRFESEDRDIYAHRDAIAKFGGLKPGDRVADVGAGTGVFTRMFAEMVGADGKVYAVDIARPFLEHIDKSAKEQGWKHVETVLGGQETTNLPEQSVDVVFICDAYHHFEKPEPMLDSMWKALKPGGRLVLIEFDRREGVSSAFVLEHIQASRAEIEARVEASGFEKVDAGPEPELKENFATVFRKTDRPEGGTAR